MEEIYQTGVNLASTYFNVEDTATQIAKAGYLQTFSNNLTKSMTIKLLMGTTHNNIVQSPLGRFIAAVLNISEITENEFTTCLSDFMGMSINKPVYNKGVNKA
jgi:hypothetical protein